MNEESIRWGIAWGVRKYGEHDAAQLRDRLGRDPLGADFEAYGVAAYEDNQVPGNLLTTAGLGRLTSLIIGAGGQAVSNTATRIGVGNGTGFAAISDTDLYASAGSTNRLFQPADTSFPTAVAGVITVQATFASADGNFAWNEFGIDVGAPTVTAGATVNALLLNHKTAIAQGTKVSGQVWVATATVTLS